VPDQPLDAGGDVAPRLLQGLVGSQQEDVVVPAELSQHEQRIAEMVFASSSRGVAERRLEVLEPVQLDTEGAVERRDGGDVPLLEVGQAQSCRPDHREVGALAEVLGRVQGRRQERQAQRVSCTRTLHSSSTVRIDAGGTGTYARAVMKTVPTKSTMMRPSLYRPLGRRKNVSP
jgi:hypothetical protein